MGERTSLRTPGPRAIVPGSLLQRACACGKHSGGESECADCKKKREAKFQRQLSSFAPVHDVPPIVHEVVRSPGQPLDVNSRAFMEPRFGHDFSGVRVHTDAKAAESARAVNALAYTVGREIVFGAGQYAPHTSGGQELLAHELTHVVQQGGTSGIQHEHDMFLQYKKDKPKAAGKKGPARHYEHRRGDWLITKYSVRGIDFLVGVPESGIGAIEGSLDAIGAAIVAGNGWISDAALKVTRCIIAPATTRYATYQDKPVLVLDPSNANAETATHEMGHAIFEQYRRTSGQPKSPTKNVELIIADIFVRLAATKVVEDNERKEGGNIKKAEHPAGLWIADPSQWSKTIATEHPWEDADEFFASARKAYLLDQKSFRAAIDKFTRLDPTVKGPANELLTVLSQLAGGKVPKAPKAMSKEEAEKEIASIPQTGKVEGTLSSIGHEVLQWTLDPSTIPHPKPAGPGGQVPEPE